jgi:N-acetylglucosaminylphosphatidylinositol deacetylase
MASWLVTRHHVTAFSKSKVVRRYVSLLLRILIFILILSILLQFILAYVVAKDPRILPPALRRAKNLLIVTAHPDDECLFFSPAILGVLGGNPEIKGGLIVLSSGPFLSSFFTLLAFLTFYRKQLRNWRNEKDRAERLLQGFEY